MRKQALGISDYVLLRFLQDSCKGNVSSIEFFFYDVLIIFTAVEKKKKYISPLCTTRKVHVNFSHFQRTTETLF